MNPQATGTGPLGPIFVPSNASAGTKVALAAAQAALDEEVRKPPPPPPPFAHSLGGGPSVPTRRPLPSSSFPHKPAALGCGSRSQNLPLSSALVRSPPPALPTRPQVNRHALLASFARPADQRLEGNQQEQTGFNAKRMEFDPDFDTDAELPLADMDFRAEDPPEEVELKLRVIEIYNTRLEERRRKRDFVLDRGFLNVKKTTTAEKRRTAEEKEHSARLRVLARFQPQEGHEALLEGIANESRLRLRLQELKELRAHGVKTLAEGEQFDLDKRRRAAEKARLRALEKSAVGPGSGAAKTNVRANRRARARLLKRGKSATQTACERVCSGPGLSCCPRLPLIESHFVVTPAFSSAPGISPGTGLRGSRTRCCRPPACLRPGNSQGCARTTRLGCAPAAASPHPRSPAHARVPPALRPWSRVGSPTRSLALLRLSRPGAAGCRGRGRRRWPRQGEARGLAGRVQPPRRGIAPGQGAGAVLAATPRTRALSRGEFPPGARPRTASVWIAVVENA